MPTRYHYDAVDGDLESKTLPNLPDDSGYTFDIMVVISYPKRFKLLGKRKVSEFILKDRLLRNISVNFCRVMI